MSFLKHDLMLVKYLSETPGEWSDLHRCDIKQNASDQSIEISVSPINDQSDEPSFRTLTLLESKKILVAEFIGENPVFYCLVPRNNTLYRFDFNPINNQFVTAGGRAWCLKTNDYDHNVPTLPLRNVFSVNEITQDRRLIMRDQSGYNHAIIVDSTETALELVKKGIPRYQATIETRDRKAIQPLDNTTENLNIWKEHTRHLQETIDFTPTANLRTEHFNKIISHVSEALLEMRQMTENLQDYVTILVDILKNTNNTTEFLKYDVYLFRTRFLTNSIEYQVMFTQETESPYLYDLCQTVLERVSAELHHYSPDASNDFINPCHNKQQRIYRPSSSQQLISISPDQEADDEAIALLLIEDEFNQTPGFSHNSQSFFRSQRQYHNTPSAYKTITGILITTCGIALAGYGLMGLIAGNIILGVLACAIGVLMSMIGIRTFSPKLGMTSETNNGEAAMIHQTLQGYGSGGMN